ncbi:MAG: serine hydroxymethyltransferase, partial [Terracidiphilus sp.]
KDTEMIDYDELEAIAEREKPKVIIGGGSAYPRLWDFARMRQIADKVGATYIFDMAHIAGLVAGGVHPSPVPHAQITTTTPEFKNYAMQIVANAKVLAATLQMAGFRIVSGGTDNHLMLVDVFQKGILGSEAELALGKAGITVNKNTIPYDTNPPLKASGIRIGTPALTTRGMKEAEMVVIAAWIAKALEQRNNDAALEKIRREVAELANRFPLYAWRRLAV